MFAIIGAVLFGLALIFDLARVGLGDVITTGTLVDAGLLCLALHLAGVATTTRSWRWRTRRR
jgi:hypothetical protein